MVTTIFSNGVNVVVREISIKTWNVGDTRKMTFYKII